MPRFFDDDQFAVGLSIKIGSDYYLIDEISDDATPVLKVLDSETGAYPTADVTAAAYSIGMEKRRFAFSATVTQWGGFSISAADASAVTSDFSLLVASNPAKSLEGWD